MILINPEVFLVVIRGPDYYTEHHIFSKKEFAEQYIVDTFDNRYHALIMPITIDKERR